ncbi:MAG: homoserine dehydrogenase [Halanaerobiaceae bacterium]|nr:homoserine dehydrogenase [Halanaerobiaceae bacterium]
MIKIGLLGLGTVGSGVYSILEKHSENLKSKIGTGLQIEKILVRDVSRQRDIDFDSGLLTDKAEDILDNPEIHLVVELIGGEEPAYQYILKALNNGKSVVTANKLLIAKYGQELMKLAAEKGVSLYFEASVAGGIPIIRPLRESFAANKIERIYGILNGTTNYILTKMTGEGQDLETALKEAQRLGYAESDPGSDISGADAAYKIAILSSLAYETVIDINDVHIEGIENIEPEDIEIARELGYLIKLLAISKFTADGVDIRVHPAFIPENHPLASVSDAYNAIYLHGDSVGDVMLYGQGAGRLPTASAVVADIIQAGKEIYYGSPDINGDIYKNVHKVMDISQVENSFYLRLQVKDKPGVLAKIAEVLGKNQVSLASVIQKHRQNPVVPIVLVTHQVKEENLQKSIAGFKNIGEIVAVNNIIRVEEL